MSNVVIGDLNLPKVNVSSKCKAAIEEFMGIAPESRSSKIQSLGKREHGCGKIDLFETFDWQYLASMPESQVLVLRIESSCNKRSCCSGSGYQKITRRSIHAAIVHQVAVDTDKLARDALGPLQTERLVAMQSYLNDPKAFLIRREIALLRALDAMRTEIEVALLGKSFGEHEAIVQSINSPGILGPYGQVKTSVGHSKATGWIIILGIETPDALLVSCPPMLKAKWKLPKDSWTYFLDSIESIFKYVCVQF